MRLDVGLVLVRRAEGMLEDMRRVAKALLDVALFPGRVRHHIGMFLWPRDATGIAHEVGVQRWRIVANARGPRTPSPTNPPYKFTSPALPAAPVTFSGPSARPTGWPMVAYGVTIRCPPEGAWVHGIDLPLPHVCGAPAWRLEARQA